MPITSFIRPLFACCRSKRDDSRKEAPEKRKRSRKFLEVHCVLCVKCGATQYYKHENNILKVKSGKKYMYWCPKCQLLNEGEVSCNLLCQIRLSTHSVKCSYCKKTTHYLQGSNTMIPNFITREGVAEYFCQSCHQFRGADSITVASLTSFLRTKEQYVMF